MTEMTGLSKVASNIGLIENIHNMETEPGNVFVIVHFI